MKNVVSFLEFTGMWAPENRAKYDFLLSPEVFPIRKDWEEQLVGFAKILREHFVIKVGGFPALCKVDLMVDQKDNLKIVEVDGLNKRAFGYAILERKIALIFGHEQKKLFPGNEHSLKRMLNGKKLFVVVPGREKYYRFGFDFLVDALRGLGIQAAWGHEKAAVRFLREISLGQVVLLDAPVTGHTECDEQLTRGWEVLIPNKSFFPRKQT